MAEKILLTGGAGYIGSHTYVALKRAGFDVDILDSFANARGDVPDRLEVITGQPVTVHRADIRDGAAVARILEQGRYDAVVHFAALKAVSESMADPLAYFDTNCGGLVTLLRAMEQAGTRRIVFSSSATVYGTPDLLPVPETAALRPENTYGYTKLMGEEIIRRLEASDPRWAAGILRYFNPAGADASGLIGEDPSDIPNNLIPYIARVAVGQAEALRVFGTDYETADGTGVRDYIHVSDLADGHVLSLKALFRDGRGHVVNLSTGQGYSVFDMLNAYSRACGRDLPYVAADRRAGDIACYYGDPALAASVLGFRATRGIDDMCASSWNWISRRRNSG